MREQKQIINVYGALVASILLMMVPLASFAIVSTLFLTGVLIAAYIIKGKSEKDSLRENHMIWIIRTIWLSCSLSAITLSLASLYIWAQIDTSFLNPCNESASNYILSAGASININEILTFINPCIEPFYQDNVMVFLVGLIIAAAPLLIFIGFRLSKGISRAAKSYRIAKPKSWF